MNHSQQLQKLQQRIGYQFVDPGLLSQALTHKSFSRQNNERLEFVGDALLGYLVGHMLFVRYPRLQEDALSLMRASLVRGSTLAEIAEEIELAPGLRLSEGAMKSGGRKRFSILADAFEALVGAVHEDGGITVCTEVVQRLFATRVEHINDRGSAPLKDPKTQLQEYLQANQQDLPEYRIEQIEGADHQRTYTVVCTVAAGQMSTIAAGSSRRAAEKAAAAQMLEKLLQNS